LWNNYLKDVQIKGTPWAPQSGDMNLARRFNAGWLVIKDGVASRRLSHSRVTM
jgi:hypothetical protein